MKDNLIVIVQKEDNKSLAWSKEANSLGITIICQKGSPIRAPLFLIKQIIKRKPNGYALRYLNDYPSFGKTLIRAASETSLILCCLLFRIKIFWICHNVDRESNDFFPRISTFRRKLTARYSTKIFVTDKLLVEKAKAVFSAYKDKIDSISFGKLVERPTGTGDTNSSAFLDEQRKMALERGYKFLCVLCTGTLSSRKSLHFSYLLQLIEKAEKNAIHVCAIVAGNVDDEHSRRLMKDYKMSAKILAFDSYTTFSFDFIRKNVDFYFRSYDDFSVPFTVYEACTLEKPVLTQDIGFLPQMIKYYQLGSVVSENLENLEQAFNEMIYLEKFHFNEFLKEKRWSSLGIKLKENL